MDPNSNITICRADSLVDDSFRNAHPRHLLLRPHHSRRVRLAPVLPGVPLHEERDKEPKPATPLDPTAVGHDPAADLQRDVRRRPADRRGLPDRLSARAARNPGPGRFDRRDARASRSWPCGATRRRASTSSTSTAPIAPDTRRRARSGPEGRRAASSSRSSTPTSSRPPISCTRTMPHFADPKVAMVQARWGHINQDYSLLTKIQSILLDGALRARARRPQPRRALLQFQRHRRHLAARRRSPTPAAGSTTR